jgi:aspartate/methionine/tyrosine aminotransferase
MNPQAEELNRIISENSPVTMNLLSERGKTIFFPKKGILGQTADAKGKRINATIGAAIEDDGSPMRLTSIEDQIRIEPEMSFPYAPSFGRPDLRKQWQIMIKAKNPGLGESEISLPVVTNALTHGLSMVGYLFTDQDQEIISPDLYWGNYNLIFSQAYHTKFKLFNLFEGDGFDLKSFESAVLDSEVGKKVILLNFPNNPTGYTPTGSEVDTVTEIIHKAALKGNNLVIVIDDAYFGFVYEDGIEEESIFAKIANLHENVLAIKIDGATKEDYVWGFRVGFITYGIKNGSPELYEALASKTAGAVRGNISNASNLSQSLLVKAFKSPSYDDEKSVKYKVLEARYKKVKSVLSDPKFNEYFKALPFNSGYFMCLKLREGLDGESIRQLLLEKYQTGLINLANTFRIAFSSVAEDNIEELFENIFAACRESEDTSK